MDNTAYLAGTTEMSALRRLDILSNNVANAGTTGFKQDAMLFEKYLVDDADKTSFIVDSASFSDFANGQYNPTGGFFDLAINGVGFFKVETPAGIRYTRNGNLKINNEGILVTNQGFPVLTSDNQNIVFGPNDMNPVIGMKGDIKVNGEDRAQIGVVEFENPLLLRKLGNNLFTANQDEQEAVNSSVLQGMLEDSNVNSIAQMAQMVDLNREILMSNHLVNDSFSRQRSAFKILSKLGAN
jgi:flagellar basal-body rod protein FlgF